LSVDFVEIKVIVDNETIIQDIRSGWGLSIFVRTPYNRILFDTGPRRDLLLDNAERIGLDLSLLDGIVISHSHGDHTGGLGLFRKLKPGLKVYVPSKTWLRNYVVEMGLEPVIVSSTRMIYQGIYIIGEEHAGWGLWEQALAIKVGNKLNVLCGCSHPGVDNLVEKAIREIGGELNIVMGGFHSPSRNELDRLISFKPRKVYPMHCSGDYAKQYLKSRYPEIFGKGGAGLSITISTMDDKL